jgi:N-carbamoyl-L-amino-acid hydrolase
MQGKRTFRVQVDGAENHAGTSPRGARRDALVSAVDIVRALQNAIWDREDAVRFTIGMFTVSPNAPSVVPGRVVFSIDLIRTFVLGVMGELANFRGLNSKTLFMIRAEVVGRVRARTARVLSVASTSRASL